MDIAQLAEEIKKISEIITVFDRNNFYIALENKVVAGYFKSITEPFLDGISQELKNVIMCLSLLCLEYNKDKTQSHESTFIYLTSYDEGLVDNFNTIHNINIKEDILTPAAIEALQRLQNELETIHLHLAIQQPILEQTTDPEFLLALELSKTAQRKYRDPSHAFDDIMVIDPLHPEKTRSFDNQYVIEKIERRIKRTIQENIQNLAKAPRSLTNLEFDNMLDQNVGEVLFMLDAYSMKYPHKSGVKYFTFVTELKQLITGIEKTQNRTDREKQGKKIVAIKERLQEVEHLVAKLKESSATSGRKPVI